MRNIFYLVIISFCLLHGCKDKPGRDSSGEMITVKLDFQKDLKSIHDIGLIKDVEVINLDCDEVIIGEIGKVIRFDTIIYLMDKSQNRNIYLFNLEGDFMNVISNYGNGPEEYVQLTDMFIDPGDSTLNIVSRVDNKLFKYDLRGEKLLAIQKTPKSFTSMMKTDNGYMAYMANWIQDPEEPYNIWLMNENLEIREHFFEIDKTLGSRSHSDGYVFSVYRDIYYYITPMDYHIYVIADDHVEAKYSFDLGRLQLPDVSKAEIMNDDKRRELVNKYVYRFYNFQETENHLVVHFIFQGQNLLGVYNKKEKEANIVELSAYEGKYFFSFGNIIGFDEETIYTTVEASKMKRMWDGKDEYNNFEEKYPEQIDNLRKKFKTIREDGNPFLVMYSIN